MIYTVTLNPAIDCVVRLDSLLSGTVNRTQSEELHAGGKGINVSLVLAQLGLKSIAMGFKAGFTGDQIEKEITNELIATDFVKLKNGFSRINIKIIAQQETEINGQGPKIISDELEALSKKLDLLRDGDTLVLAGSIPSALPDNTYDLLSRRVKDKSIRLVVDASGRPLLSTLKYRPFLIKPNLAELSETVGAEINSEDELDACAEELKRLGARNILVSMGSNGAVLIAESGKKYKAPALERKAVNSAGSGDSMVAGFIAGYEQTGKLDAALRLASACGNAAALSSGLPEKTKIYELLKIIEVI